LVSIANPRIESSASLSPRLSRPRESISLQYLCDALGRQAVRSCQDRRSLFVADSPNFSSLCRSNFSLLSIKLATCSSLVAPKFGLSFPSQVQRMDAAGISADACARSFVTTGRRRPVGDCTHEAARPEYPPAIADQRWSTSIFCERPNQALIAIESDVFAEPSDGPAFPSIMIWFLALARADVAMALDSAALQQTIHHRQVTRRFRHQADGYYAHGESSVRKRAPGPNGRPIPSRGVAVANRSISG